jgi:signal transduction histidine kinase
MRTISSWLVPVSLTLCAALVIGALAWITQGTLAAERERSQADARADVQERTRLALWRMDSLGAVLLLDESGHPDVPSRLPVQLRFTLSPKGEIRANNPEKETPDNVFRQTIGTGRQALDRVSAITMTPAPVPETKELSKREAKSEGKVAPYDRLNLESQVAANWGEQNVRSKAVQSTLYNATLGQYRNAPAPTPAPSAAIAAEASAEVSDDHGGFALDLIQEEATMQKNRSAKVIPQAVLARDADEDGNTRGRPGMHAQAPFAQPAAENTRQQAPSSQTRILAEEIADYTAEPVASQPRVAWVNDLLLLARRVNGMGNDAVFDGAWIDHDALASLLLGEVGDLLANASLIPAHSPGTDGMVLASFPFRLEVPTPAAVNVPLRESTLVSLAMSWTAALIALAATMWLVRGVMRLSERRASFVSAVTHELRTPLTTFRLYSDMLESGAVKEEKRGDYLRVLSREADRLTHLVENVLAFSRIERGNARSQVRDIDADELLENMRERLEARLESAGLHLALDLPRGLRVRADQAAVEHILFNLIDNAAKYAAASDPPVVTITAARVGNSVCLRIRDHGPGIPAAEMRRIFRPFHKSAHEAAETKPGVGLGLALSRRLAQEQGGELSCLRGEQGACFELRLPAAGTP